MILGRETRNTGRETCPIVTHSTTNFKWIDLESNPGFHGERKTTNRLSDSITFKD
jgi:hypothetical protein